MTYSTVTELPGNYAHRDQIAAIETRYMWASEFCIGKDVLEIACGAGLGLGLLKQVSKSLVACDIDDNVLNYARSNFKGSDVNIIKVDAKNLCFQDQQFDVILCFEAIYYFESLSHFIKQVKRVLKPNGILLITSVNPQWLEFNPSPFSTNYYNIKDLVNLLESQNFKTVTSICFQSADRTLFQKFTICVRKIAIKFGLIPKTMKGKAFLKKLFYGKLQKIPNKIVFSTADYSKPQVIRRDDKLESYKFYYVKAENKVFN